MNATDVRLGRLSLPFCRTYINIMMLKISDTSLFYVKLISNNRYKYCNKESGRIILNLYSVGIL
jgi:hypothetical protein